MSRIVIVVDGGVAYTYADPDVEVCILDLGNERDDDGILNPVISPEKYKGFEDLVPEYLI